MKLALLSIISGLVGRARNQTAIDINAMAAGQAIALITKPILVAPRECLEEIGGVPEDVQ